MLNQEVAFVGLDVYNSPTQLGPGYLQQADNLILRGGDLETRPGIMGLLASAMSGGAVYALMSYLRADNGHETLIFAQAGKLWQWDATAGTGSPSELQNTRLVSGALTTGSFSFANGGAAVRLARYGKWLFGCDGVGQIFHLNLESSQCGTCAVMIAPGAPVVALTNTTLEPCSNTVPWEFPADGSVATSIYLNSELYDDPVKAHDLLPDWHNLGLGEDGTSAWTVTGSPIATGTPSGSTVSGITYYAGQIGLTGSSSFTTTIPAANLPTVTTSGPLTFGGTIARSYVFKVYVFQADTTAASSVVINMVASDSSGNVLGSVTREITPAYVSGDAVPYTEYDTPLEFLTAPYGVDPAQIMFTMTAGAKNGSSASTTVWFCAPILVATGYSFNLTEVGGDSFAADVAQAITVYVETEDLEGTESTHDVGSLGFNGAVQYAIARRNYGNDTTQTLDATSGLYYTDLSGSDILSMGISVPSTSLTSLGDPPNFRLGFQTIAATGTADEPATWYSQITWGNEGTYSTDQTYVSFDISTVAVSIRQRTTALILQCLDDLPNRLPAPAAVFTFGPITVAGNLTVGDVYTYIFDEIETVTTSATVYDVIESSGSVLTTALTAAGNEAEVAITIPAATNNGYYGRGLADTFTIWRGGGVFNDGFWRMIGSCPFAAPTAGARWCPGYTGSGSYSDPQGVWEWVSASGSSSSSSSSGSSSGSSSSSSSGSSSSSSSSSGASGGYYQGVLTVGWTYTPATGLFVDNVPDSGILLADLYEINRDYWPTGAVDPTNPGSADPRGAISCLCESNGRLFGAAGNTVYASWLLSTDAEAGLYTSNSIDPTDPSLSIKGMSFPLGSGQNADTVSALITLSTAIVALRQDVISHIEGYDPTNFASVDRYQQAGIGCVAPMAAVADSSGGALNYLSAMGIIEYNLDTPKPAGQEIEPLLGVGDGTEIAAGGAFAGAVQVHHDRRRFLFCPALATDPTAPEGASTTLNSVAYIFDSRGDTPGWSRWTGSVVQMSSACTAGGILYMGGLDGMLYWLSAGYLDKATSGAAGSGITMTVTTRAVGEEYHHPFGWQGQTIYPMSNTIPAMGGPRAGAQMVDQGGEGPRREKRAGLMYFDLWTASADVPVNLSLYGSSNPEFVWGGTWTTRSDGGVSAEKMRTSTAVRGVELTMGFSATVTGLLRLHMLGIESAVGRRK